MAREKLEDELDRVLGGRTPGFEDLGSLAYTEMVFKESMRLMPPVWGLSRLVAEEDEVGGYRVPAGSRVVISQYVTHRHPDFWEKPDQFSPERFGPDSSAGRPKYSYFPFSGGPPTVHRQQLRHYGGQADSGDGSPGLQATPGTGSSRRT